MRMWPPIPGISLHQLVGSDQRCLSISGRLRRECLWLTRMGFSGLDMRQTLNKFRLLIPQPMSQ